MRGSIKAVVALLFVAVAAASSHAQVFPGALGVDSSFGMELLLGSQTIRESAPQIPQVATYQLDRFKFDFDPRLPVVTGTAEISPLQWLSGRLGGSVAVLTSDSEMFRSVNLGVSTFSGWSKHKPEFGAWEAAGLYHLWNGGGYRFSVTSGFRQQLWRYSGRSMGDAGSGQSQDRLTSNIPFIGLQTAMYFPWWKARFEILGSPFMNKRVAGSYSQSGTSASWNVHADRGGYVDCRMQGTVNVTPSVSCGLSARLSYEELFGTFEGTIGGGSPLELGAYLRETMGYLGLDVTVLF